MKDIITFEELYKAYILCLKNKKNKAGTKNVGIIKKMNKNQPKCTYLK